MMKNLFLVLEENWIWKKGPFVKYSFPNTWGLVMAEITHLLPLLWNLCSENAFHLWEAAEVSASGSIQDLTHHSWLLIGVGSIPFDLIIQLGLLMSSWERLWKKQSKFPYHGLHIWQEMWEVTCIFCKEVLQVHKELHPTLNYWFKGSKYFSSNLLLLYVQHIFFSIVHQLLTTLSSVSFKCMKFTKEWRCTGFDLFCLSYVKQIILQRGFLLNDPESQPTLSTPLTSSLNEWLHNSKVMEVLNKN